MKQGSLLLLTTVLLLTACQQAKKDFWPNGNPRSEILMNGDSYEGTARYWYEDGTLQMLCNYRDNKIDGVLRSYYPSGSLQEEQYYTAGLMNGAAKAWDPEGNLLKESNYKTGVLHGRYREYYTNKMPRIDGQYIDGNHDGLWLYYDDFGKVVGQGNFTMGTGVQKTYYPDGHLRQVTNYVKNEKDGEEIFYTTDGSAETVNIFRNGKLINKINK